MDWIMLMVKSLFGGAAALGFAILFNVPKRTLIFIFIMGITSILFRNGLIILGVNIIFASFIGASMVGILSLLAARNKQSPPLVFSIPGVIPMVPGIFSYRLMIGIIKLTTETGPHFNEVMHDTVHNGLKAAFILMALAVGVSFPNLIFRTDSFHDVSIPVIQVSKKTKH